MSIKLYSWNVLHIIHELNYASDCCYVLDNWLNNESERLREIAKIIVKHSSYSKAIFCIQECPGDLLNLLHELNTHNDFTINTYRYPRHPKIKNHNATNPYIDSTEQLVILLGKDIMLRELKSIQFEDPGKASLIAKINIFDKNISIANIHCPFGPSRSVAFKQLLEEIIDDTYIIIGDMNSDENEIKKMFNDKKYVFSNISKPTRIAKSIRKTKKGNVIEIRETIIDHVIGSIDLTYKNIFVGNQDNLSDHLIIGTDVHF